MKLLLEWDEQTKDGLTQHSVYLCTYDLFLEYMIRKPIHVQYSEVFTPFLGVLSPNALHHSFKASLMQMQKDKPVYDGQLGAHGWWSEVIKRTAIGAGADPHAVDLSLNKIVSRLMDRFSSSEGYKLFDDALPVLRQLQEMNVRTALISNSDARMRYTTGLVLADLGISSFLNPLILSEEEGVEKPDAEIFRRALQAVDTRLNQGVHVGDELDCDYCGAKGAGMQALLIRRPSPDGDQEHKKPDEDLRNIQVVSSLYDVVGWVRSQSETDYSELL